MDAEMWMLIFVIIVSFLFWCKLKFANDIITPSSALPRAPASHRSASASHLSPSASLSTAASTSSSTIATFSSCPLATFSASSSSSNNQRGEMSAYTPNNANTTKNVGVVDIHNTDILRNRQDKPIYEQGEEKFSSHAVSREGGVHQSKVQYEPVDMDHFLRTSREGVKFLKYGRYGRPHDRIVKYDEAKQMFSWGDSDMQNIHLPYVLEVVEGCQTKVFKRPSIYFNFKFDDLCFSLVTASRTLDLQAKDNKTKDEWVACIRLLIKHKGKIVQEHRAPKYVQAKAREFVPFINPTPGKEYKFETVVENVDLLMFKNAYHGRVQLGRKIGDTTVVEIKYLVQEPGYLERVVSYKMEPTFFTKFCGDTGQMECRCLDEENKLSISLINRSGAKYASITETLIVTAASPTSVHILQTSVCSVTVNAMVNSLVQDFWYSRYKKYHESGEFLKEYNFDAYRRPD